MNTVGYLDDGHFCRGDLAYLPGLGTYATVIHKNNPNLVRVVKIDPFTGKFIDTIATLNGYSAQFSLASVGDYLLAFGVGGEILEIDPVAKSVGFIVDSNLEFYGAAGPLEL